MTTDHWITLGGLVAYSAFECWLGRTEKLKAGSFWELAFSFGKAAIALTIKKRF